MAYTEQTWTDGAAGGTPIDAARLTHMEDGIFNAAATADAAIPSSQKGAANGVASLDSTGKVPTAQLPAGSGGSSVVDWVSVKDHGAVGDGTTDDTTAVQAALNAVPAAGGVVYFPAGTYLISTGLTVTNRTTLIGDGSSNQTDTGAISALVTASATLTLLTLSAGGTRIAHLTLRCTATTPTSGAGISVTNGDGNRYDGLVVANFYNGLDLISGSSWYLNDCAIRDFRNYGVKVQNTTNADAGDSVIAGCVLSPKAMTAQAGLRYETSGGLKVSSCKFVGAVGTDQFARAVDASFTANTSDLLISNCSFENATADAIRLATTGTVDFGNIVIVGNQIALYSNTTGSAVKLTGTAAGSLYNVAIADNVMKQNGGTGTVAAISLTNVNRAQIGPNVVEGFTAHLTQTTCTNITEWLTPGTLTVQDEGTALTQRSIIDFAGAGVTATDDAANSRTLVTIPGGTASGGEMLVTNGTSNPPVGLTTEDGTDFLYQG